MHTKTRPQHQEPRPLLFTNSEWFFNVPQRVITNRGCETRRLESLTIADVITKAALSPQLFKDPECPAGVWTHDLPHGSPVLYQLS